MDPQQQILLEELRKKIVDLEDIIRMHRHTGFDFSQRFDKTQISRAQMINEAVLGDGINNPGKLVLQVAEGKGDTEVRAGIASGDFANSGAINGFIFGLDDSDSNIVKFYWGNATKYIKWDGTDLTVVGSSVDKFGGSGADGALDTSGGTVDIDLGAAQIVTKNYTSINVVTNNLTFSNPHASGTVIKLKSQGNVTISATAGSAGMGAAGGAGGAGGASGNSGSDGAAGTDGISGGVRNTSGAKGIGGATSGTDGTGGAGGTSNVIDLLLMGKNLPVSCGAGGGGGGGGRGSGGDTGGAGGNGGRGGSVVWIECGGALNFTGTVNAAGGAGVVGGAAGGAGGGRSGGGGGGGGGNIVVLYKTLTANTGTLDVSLGTGGGLGTGGNEVGSGGAGGGGAGSASNGIAGAAGDATGTGIGGNGGTGAVLVVQNTEFA